MLNQPSFVVLCTSIQIGGKKLAEGVHRFQHYTEIFGGTKISEGVHRFQHYAEI